MINERVIFVFDKKQFAHVFDVKDFNRLEINLTGTDLVIRQAENAGIIYYGEQKDDDRFEMKQEGHTLRITEKSSLNVLKKTFAFKFSVGKSRLEVTIPQADFLKLSAEVTKGDVAIDNVKTSTINLIVGSGALTVADSTIDNLDVKAQSGNLVMKKTLLGNAKIENRTGDILFDEFQSGDSMTAAFAEGRLKMRDVTFNDAKITLGQGDVRVRGFKATGDFNLSTNIGDLSLRQIQAPTITIAAIRGNDLQNPASVEGLPQHERGHAGASFLTSAGHLDVNKEIEITKE